MQEKIKKEVLAKIQNKKKEIPFELLGRSLSVNPFSPRDIKTFLLSSEDESFKTIAQIENFDNENLNFLKIAQEYLLNGASAISIITESDIEYLSHIRRYVSIPLIREGFILDKYQIMESLVYGADAIVLNAKLLSMKELKELYEYSLHIGLESFIEIYDKEDLKKAIKCGTNVILINDKNLLTSKINDSIFKELIPMIPNRKIIVAKCKNINLEKLNRLNNMGVDAFFCNEKIPNVGENS